MRTNLPVLLLPFCTALVALAQPQILTRELPKATLNQAYSQMINASGGTPPYSITCDKPFPQGLTLSSNGLITGTPTVVDADFYLCQVRDARLLTSEARIGLSTGRGSLNFDTQILPPGRLGQFYDQQITVSGGTPPYRFSSDQPVLFSGLPLTSAGRFTGEPMEIPGFGLTKVLVEDAAGNAASAYVGLSISNGEPLIRNGELPRAIQGSPFRQPIPLATGDQSVRISLGFGPSLPPGLTLDANRMLSGTPLAVGRYRFHVYASIPGSGSIGFASFTMQVIAPFQLVSASNIDVPVGVAFQSAITVEGLATPFRFELVRGTLPPGLQLVGNAFSGLTTQAGVFNATLRVTDSQGRSADFDFVFRATDLRLQFSLARPPDPAVLYTPFRLQTLATGGRPPYTFSLQSGALPSGLRLNSTTGELSGIPIHAGLSDLTLRARDTSGATQDLPLTISIPSPRRLAGGEVGRPYRFLLRDFFASRGFANLNSFTLRSDPIPGLTLSREGVWTGTPEAPGEYPVAVVALDAAAQNYLIACNLYVAPGQRRIEPAALPGGVVGRRYRQQLSAVGLNGPLRWNLVQGSLPTGLSFNSATSTLEGTPTAVSAGSVLLEAVDASGPVRSSFYIVITEAGTPQIDFIGNAASYDAGGVSPGELLTIFGTGLGPDTLALFTPQSGLLPSTLANVRVWFGDEAILASPLLYSSNTQTSVITPFQIPAFDPLRIVVERDGNKSAPYTVIPRLAKPAFFTSDGSGRGQIAALNEDGSVNSMANPARPGSIVVLFLTGIGPMLPAGRDGAIATATSAPASPSSASVNGIRAEILYLGNAPGLVQGVAQANLRLPTGTRTGENQISIVIGGNATPTPTTVWVRD
jgi:uncharacterized protein (TIGR03437 family)